MAPSIETLIRDTESSKLDAERRAGRSKEQLRNMKRSLEQSKVPEHLWTDDQVKRMTDLYEEHTLAVGQIREADRQLAGLREIEADEARLDAQAREVRPSGAARGPSFTADLGKPSLNPMVADGRSSSNSAEHGGAAWMRQDGRPAAVTRGQRFGDHEVVRQEIEHHRGRDNVILGQYGDIGQQMRALTTTSGSAIVPTVWAGQIIDRARNYAAVYRAGAQTVPMDAKIVQIGRLTVDPTAAFRTEGSTITASDPTFDNVTLTAKTMNALVVASNEFWQDASNAGELVTDAMAQALAAQLDLVCLFGGVTTGAEQGAVGNNLLPSGGLPNPPNPTGILATLLASASSSVLGGGANGTSQTAATFYGEVVDTLYFPRHFNEAPNAMLWPSRLAQIYDRAADTQNNPMQPPPVVAGVEKHVTNQIPSGMTQGTGTLMADLFVGDFRQVLVGQRLDLTVKVLDQRYAELGQTAVLVSWRGDVAVTRPRAFAVFRYLKGM